jgi:hypothetical protein
MWKEEYKYYYWSAEKWSQIIMKTVYSTMPQNV